MTGGTGGNGSPPLGAVAMPGMAQASSQSQQTNSNSRIMENDGTGWADDGHAHV